MVSLSVWRSKKIYRSESFSPLVVCCPVCTGRSLKAELKSRAEHLHGAAAMMALERSVRRSGGMMNSMSKSFSRGYLLRSVCHQLCYLRWLCLWPLVGGKRINLSRKGRSLPLVQGYRGSIVRLHVYSSESFGRGPALNVLMICVQTGVIPLHTAWSKA